MMKPVESLFVALSMFLVIFVIAVMVVTFQVGLDRGSRWDEAAALLKNIELRPVYCDVLVERCDDCKSGLWPGPHSCQCKYKKLFTGRLELVDKKGEEKFNKELAEINARIGHAPMPL